MIKKIFSVSLTALTVCFGLPGALSAQTTDWPTRPVTMVVPFPPGGPTDLIARVIAKQLSDQLGQTFVVDNKGGANGNIGGQAVASSKADGYTVLYNTSSLALSPSLYKDLSYNPQKDLVPVTTTAVVPLVLVINPNFPLIPLKNLSPMRRKIQASLPTHHQATATLRIWAPFS